MSFILVDLADTNHDIQINGWNWRPTLELIRDAKLLHDEHLERMGTQGTGTTVSKDQALAIARLLETKILPRLESDEIIHFDGKVSKESTAPRTLSADPYDLYVARRSWLETFVAFCRSCDGFEVV